MNRKRPKKYLKRRGLTISLACRGTTRVLDSLQGTNLMVVILGNIRCLLENIDVYTPCLALTHAGPVKPSLS